MTRTVTRIAMIALTLAAAGWLGAPAWACGEGKVIKVGTAGVWNLNADEGEGFNVADLADGETRVFGETDRQVTVTRNGDEVTISYPAGQEGSPVSVVCDLDRDDCRIVTFEEGPARTAIVIRKSTDCDDAAGDCARVLLTELSIGDEPTRMLIRKKIDCAGDDCVEAEETVQIGGKQSFATVQVMTDGLTVAGSEDVMLLGQGEGAYGFVVLGDGDGVVLRCPEGDTTMRVDREEADRTYLCPMHSLPLEKAPAAAIPRKVKIIKKDAAD